MWRGLRALGFVGFAVFLGLGLGARSGETISTPVQNSHLVMIESLLKKNGLPQASVRLDRFGRVELRGSYQDKREVEVAFSLAQTVVGVKWVSPVTPENIKVKEWEKQLTGLFENFARDQAAKEARERAARDTVKTPPRPPAFPGAGEGALKTPVNRYAVVAGVGRFQEKKINPLEFTENDAKQFYQYLISPNGGQFKKENVSLFLNEEATKANIGAALDAIKRKAEPDDLVVLYLSSHGTPPAPFGGVFVITYDSIVDPRHRVWETSINDDMLKDFINGVRANRLVVVMDACYSNGAYKNVQGFLPAGGKSLTSGDDDGSGSSRAFMAEKLLGAKDILLDEEPSAKPSAKGGGAGKVLISSSDEGEKSWESESLQNSFFTYYFIEGLKKHSGVREAFDYARPKVVEGVLREKQHPQHPQIAATTREHNIQF